MSKKAIKVALIIICVTMMLAVWPFALIRTERQMGTALGVEYRVSQETISETVWLKQVFEAQTSRLESISIALEFPEDVTGILTFELL